MFCKAGQAKFLSDFSVLPAYGRVARAQKAALSVCTRTEKEQGSGAEEGTRYVPEPLSAQWHGSQTRAVRAQQQNHFCPLQGIPGPGALSAQAS